MGLFSSRRRAVVTTAAIASSRRRRSGDAAPAATSQAAAPTVADTSDVIAQIKQLADLKDQGILTQEEFDAKKKQLLGL